MGVEKRIAKQAEYLKNSLDRYEGDLDEQDLAVLQQITDNLIKFPCFWYETEPPTSYLSLIAQQNLIIIKQLNRLNKNIEDMKNKD